MAREMSVYGKQNSKTSVRNGNRALEEEFIGCTNVITFVTLGCDCSGKIMSKSIKAERLKLCALFDKHCGTLCLPGSVDVKKPESRFFFKCRK